jgi:hypothetical protein
VKDIVAENSLVVEQNLKANFSVLIVH